jgi:hypothetical protein
MCGQEEPFHKRVFYNSIIVLILAQNLILLFSAQSDSCSGSKFNLFAGWEDDFEHKVLKDGYWKAYLC